MDENPYQPPRESNVDTNTTRRPRSIIRVMGEVLVACFVWVFGGFFLALMICFAVFAGGYQAGADRQRAMVRVTDFIFLPMISAAGLGVTWAAYSAIAPIRIAAWATAGVDLGVVVSRVTGIPHDFFSCLPSYGVGAVGYRLSVTVAPPPSVTTVACKAGLRQPK
jgi:hypothetical protein